MNVLKNIIWIILSVALAYFTGEWFGAIYNSFFPPAQPIGLSSFFNSVDLSNISAGVVPAYITYLTLLFFAFGDKYKYWWTGVLLLPALYFVLKYDLSHWYFYVALALIGWLLGWAISRLLKKQA